MAHPSKYLTSHNVIVTASGKLMTKCKTYLLCVMDLSKAVERREENIGRNELVLTLLGYTSPTPKKRRTFSGSTERNGSLSVLNKLSI